MDDDVKQYLDGKFESAARLVTEVKESLEREIHTGIETLQTRFDAQALRCCGWPHWACLVVPLSRHLAYRRAYQACLAYLQLQLRHLRKPSS